MFVVVRGCVEQMCNVIRKYSTNFLKYMIIIYFDIDFFNLINLYCFCTFKCRLAHIENQ